MVWVLCGCCPAAAPSLVPRPGDLISIGQVLRSRCQDCAEAVSDLIAAAYRILPTGIGRRRIAAGGFGAYPGNP